MDYRKITPEDAHFLTKVFSVPEYDLYFAENETTEEDWRERITLFDDVQSLIVSDWSKDVGWLITARRGNRALSILSFCCRRNGITDTGRRSSQICLPKIRRSKP